MFNKNLKKQMIITLLLSNTLIVDAAETGQPNVDPDIDFNGSDCIWIRSIRDYQPLDDRTLLIWSGARPYFVKLTTFSRDMRSGIGMRVDSRDDRLCPYGGDGLSFGSFSRMSTGVRAISRISKDQAEELLVRYGKSDAEEPQTPAPRDVKGADVAELD